MATKMNDMKPSSVKQIQGTNDSSSLSKKSTENLGYFKDIHLSNFVSKRCRRSPVIHRGYYIRFKAVDFIVRQFLNFFADSDRLLQVLSLGAGFDTTFFRLKEECPLVSRVAYFEVDFEGVVDRKMSMINQCESLEKLIPNNDPRCFDSRAGPGYWLIACNLNSTKDFSAVLNKAQVDRDAPTLILSECAITYMPVEASNALISYTATAFSNAIFAVYEQIRPQDGFGNVMQKHFESLSVPLQSIRTFPSLPSQECRYMERGWEVSIAVDMLYFYSSCIPQQEKERVEDIEPFDEYEEFHSVLSHYTLVSSGIGESVELVDSLYPKRVAKSKVHSCELSVKYEQAPDLNRFGHCSAVCGDRIVTIGGFGATDSGHKRLSDVVITHTASLSSERVFTPKSDLVTRMHASASTLAHDRVLIFGGRLSPKAACDVQACVVKIHGNDLDLSPVTTKEGPSPRWRHAACLIDDDGIPHLFVFGGKDSRKVLGDCWILNTRTWKWREIEASGCKPSARMSASVCCLNGDVFLVGGLKANTQISSSVYRFTEGKWGKLEVCGMPPIYSSAVTGYKNKLLIVGGYSDDSTEIGVVDLNSNSYHELRMTVPSQLLHGHSVVICNGNLIVLGGGGNCFSFGTCFNGSLLVVPLTELIK